MHLANDVKNSEYTAHGLMSQNARISITNSVLPAAKSLSRRRAERHNIDEESDRGQGTTSK